MINILFTGAAGSVFYASMSLLIMTLMLMLSIRLLISRQKRAYLTLSICTAVMLLGQFGLLGAGLMGIEAGRSLSTIRNLLDAVCFILANLSIYQLYGETTKRIIRATFGLIIGSLLLSFIPIVHSIYELLLIPFTYIVVGPLMKSDGKYKAGLLLFSIASLAKFLNIHIFEVQYAALHVIDNLLHIGFYVVLFLILIDRVMELMENSYDKSTRDALTGLFNRVYFYTTVSFLISERTPVSIVFIDLDDFKKLNDTRGHEEGDKALKEVADILKEEVEELGIAGRYGGEEMVIMIEDQEIQLNQFTERIRSRIENETIVTASIGHASYTVGITAEVLIKNADNAMYIAKKSGKNKVIAFTEM